MARDARDKPWWDGVKPVLGAKNDDRDTNRGLGTAFVCGRKGTTFYLLTCRHVVEAIGEDNLRVEKRPAQVVACGDEALDLALLKVDDLDDLDDLPDSEILFLANAGHLDLPFRTFGHFWTDKKERVADSRELNGKLGQRHRKVSDRYGYVAGWEFSVTQGNAFDKLRPGYSGAPVFDPISKRVVAVISHQEGDALGHAIAVSNLRTICPHADNFFRDSPSDEGEGGDHWIVKTLDHRQVAKLRRPLNAADPPVVAIVEGCTKDCPKYLADDVLLDPWPGFDEIPPDATTLNPTRYGEDEAAFWAALYHKYAAGDSQQVAAGDQKREACCKWLRKLDRHLFFVSCSMEIDGWRLRRLIRAGQDFLAELARQPMMPRALLLLACQSSGDCPPWWWSWWRLYLQRTPGVLWLEPLRPLQPPDLDEWYNGFTNKVKNWLVLDRLRDELLKLFDAGHAVRYQHVRECLLDDGALERARKKKADFES